MRVVLALSLCASLAAATERPLQYLPAEKLTAMAPLLRHGEVALIESNPDGRQKQVTIMALVAAPPELVHDVFLDASKYPEFVNNMTVSKVTPHPDGTFDQDFWIDLKLTHFEATYRFKPHPDGSVDVEAVDPNDEAVYRWEFYRVPGGTVLVMYGYTDVLHSNGYITKITNRVPSMEHGLAFATQFAYVRAMKRRAEGLAKPGSFQPLDPKAKGPGFDFLLKRGRVAVVRSLPNGALSDVSILDRIYAPRAKVEQVLTTPGEYASFLDGVKSVKEVSRTPEEIVYNSETDISLLDWDSKFSIRSDGKGGVDFFGTSGDLRGAHYRWDLTQTGPKETLAVFRQKQDLLAASPLLLGAVFHVDPVFEHGLDVALALVQMNGMRGRSEGWK